MQQITYVLVLLLIINMYFNKFDFTKLIIFHTYYWLMVDQFV